MQGRRVPAIGILIAIVKQHQSSLLRDDFHIYFWEESTTSHHSFSQVHEASHQALAATGQTAGAGFTVRRPGIEMRPVLLASAITDHLDRLGIDQWQADQLYHALGNPCGNRVVTVRDPVNITRATGALHPIFTAADYSALHVWSR